MHNDNAYHTVVADGVVFWGSSVTNKVYAVGAARGKLRWYFATEGPIRFAPTISNERVYVGSDDGYVYCLDARNGVLMWKYRPGPSNEKVIGNGRMISLWPVRTGVLVDDNVAFRAAGSSKGPIYCFGTRKRKEEKVIRPKGNPHSYPG